MNTHFWQQRSKREKCLLLSLLWMTIGLAAYSYAWPPLQQHQETLRADIQQQAIKWRWLQQYGHTLTNIQNISAQQDLAKLEKNITTRYPQAKITTQTQGTQAKLSLTSIGYASLLQLIDQLQSQGLQIADLNLHGDEQGNISANLMYNKKPSLAKPEPAPALQHQ